MIPRLRAMMAASGVRPVVPTSPLLRGHRQDNRGGMAKAVAQGQGSPAGHPSESPQRTLIGPPTNG